MILPILKNRKGFTLIELIVVIAILGVLAAIVIAAVNPLEQIARGRDAGRVTVGAQLSRAVQAFYTTQNATLPNPTSAGTWIDKIVSNGDIKSPPAVVGYSLNSAVPCTTIAIPNGDVQNNYCFAIGTAAPTNYIIYVRLESSSQIQKCASAAGGANQGASNYPFWMYSSKDGKSGIVCMQATAPTQAQIDAGGFGTTAAGTYAQ